MIGPMLAGGLARDGREPAAHLPDHARHGDRRRRGDPDARRRPGRAVHGRANPSPRWAATCSSCCPAPPPPAACASGGATPTLTMADAEAIAELPSIAAVAPVAPGAAQLVYGANNWSTLVTGTTPGYLDVRDWSCRAGYPFTDSDVRSGDARRAARADGGAEICSATTIRSARPSASSRVPFSVIGVLAAKGQSLDGQRPGRHRPDSRHHRPAQAVRHASSPAACASSWRRRLPRRRWRSPSAT